MKRELLTLLFGLLLIGFSTAQELDVKPESEADLTQQLKEVDEDALFLRVDELTETVNTHTDQIAELAERIKAIESKPVAVSSPIRKNLLGTELKKPVKLSFGSVGSLNSTGTTFAPVVSYGAPIISYGTPMVRVSNPITYQLPSQIFSPPTQQLSAFPSQQFTDVRTVRRPVQQIRTTNVQYAPVQANQPRLGSRLINFFSPGNCPGGICPQ